MVIEIDITNDSRIKCRCSLSCESYHAATKFSGDPFLPFIRLIRYGQALRPSRVYAVSHGSPIATELNFVSFRQACVTDQPSRLVPSRAK